MNGGAVRGRARRQRAARLHELKGDEAKMMRGGKLISRRYDICGFRGRAGRRRIPAALACGIPRQQWRLV